MPNRPPIVVYDLAQAVAALDTATDFPVVFYSFPGAAALAGAGWWRALTEQVRAMRPDIPFQAVLDCGDAPGHVLAALRHQVHDIRFSGPADIAAKLADIAGQQGARLHVDRSDPR